MKAPALGASAFDPSSREARRTPASYLQELVAASLDGDGRVDMAHWRRALLDPALDFVARPGKQLRGRLVEHAYALAGGEGAPREELGMAIELLHAGSLIVDDIEDGSVMRRGSPALHRTRGLPTALNTGNWLYFIALDLLGRAEIEEGGVPADRCAVRTLLRCHHGQALDVSVRVGELRQDEVLGVVATITSLKTASLMELAASLAAAAAGAGPERSAGLARFGHELGVVLQMLDDLSSVTSPARRDKGAEDLALARATWPWAWVAAELDEASFSELQGEARRVAAGAAPEPLLEALRGGVETLGLEAARARIAPALEVARSAGGAPAALDAIEAELRGWEAEFGA